MCADRVKRCRRSIRFLVIGHAAHTKSIAHIPKTGSNISSGYVLYKAVTLGSAGARVCDDVDAVNVAEGLKDKLQVVLCDVKVQRADVQASRPKRGCGSERKKSWHSREDTQEEDSSYVVLAARFFSAYVGCTRMMFEPKS